MQKSIALALLTFQHSNIRRSSLRLVAQLYMSEPHSVVPIKDNRVRHIRSCLELGWNLQGRHLGVGSQFSTQCLVCYMLENKHTFQNLQTIGLKLGETREIRNNHSFFNDFAKAELCPAINVSRSLKLQKFNLQSILSMKERVYGPC